MQSSRSPNSLFALGLLPLALAMADVAVAQTPPAPPEQKSTPVRLVDALNGVFGQHPGARAVHAKGIVLEGAFTPSRSAHTVSTAPHLQKAAVPVVVRFSDFAGIPDIADNHALAAPRGLAVKFTLPGGATTDIVSHAFNGFPSRSTPTWVATRPPRPSSRRPSPSRSAMARCRTLASTRSSSSTPRV
jgi:catalase